ncbi:MAG: PHB depolymerase family esterase [Ignavibacterium sp.]|nr:PHB depolymerase family esterase [Ignavibacterium sp.]
MKTLLFFLITFLTIPYNSYSQDIEDTLMLYGRNRFYKIHLPTGYSFQKYYPLVFVFHGGLGNPDIIAKQTKFSEKADKEGFIVVYPYGTGSFNKKLLTWNTWDCCGYADKNDINDVDFIDAVLKRIKSEYLIDEKKIFATGLSNGGMMCYLLACELSEHFAAIAPVAASMFDTVSCNPETEISIIAFNSINDENIPYNGVSEEDTSARMKTLPVEKVIDMWAKNFNCVHIRTSDSSLFQKVNYINEKGVEITLFKMFSGGHSWPGGEKIRKFADNPVKNVSATDIIWEFFKSNPKR